VVLNAELLARHLRQLAELGEPHVVLDRWTRTQALRALATAPAAPAVHESPAAYAVVESSGPAAGIENGALTVLAQEAAGCMRCGLHAGRTTVVFGEGDPRADLLVVGEAPGQEEDRTGRPFVGRAGKLLDLLLMSAGFPRASVYICNVLKCRPPNNRNPLPDETATCVATWLRPQIEAVAPRALLAVGRFAVQALLETDAGIGRLRGRIHDYNGAPVVVSYHPAYLLRSPHAIRAAWDDFQMIRTILDEQG